MSAKRKKVGIKGTGGEIVLYQAKDGRTTLDVRLEQETIWVAQKQMAALFATERSVITKHLNNIFRSGELQKDSNVQKMHIADSDKPVTFYSLDANGLLYRKDGSKRFADNALVALTLLIAESKAAEKDTLCKVIVNLINRDNF